jgi:hypothetical protein
VTSGDEPLHPYEVRSCPGCDGREWLPGAVPPV